VFPCLHAFHRECSFNFIKEYKTKDIKVNALISTVKGYYGQIDAVKARAQLAASQGTGSMFAGAFGNFGGDKG